MPRSPGRTRALALVAAAGALALSCGQGDRASTAAPPYPAPEVARDGQVVTKIGDVVLTTVELERRLAQQSPILRAQMKNDPELRKKFVENEIKAELLAQEGWRQGLYKDPKIQAELRRAIVQRMMKDKLQAVAANPEITDQELIAAYEKRKAEFVKPEKIRLSIISLAAPTPAAKLAAKKKLEALQATLEKEQKKGNDAAFAAAAKTTSEDESKKDGGDLQFLTREDLTQRMGQAAAERLFDKTEIGEAGLLELDGAVALVKKTGKRRGVERTLEMVKPQLRTQLIGEKKSALFDGYVADLEKKLGVVVDEAALGSVKIDVAAPPGQAQVPETPRETEASANGK